MTLSVRASRACCRRPGTCESGSQIWPLDPSAPVEPVGTLFTDLPAQSWPAIGLPAEGPAVDDELESIAPTAAAGPGLWDAHGGALAAALPSAADLLA